MSIDNDIKASSNSPIHILGNLIEVSGVDNTVSHVGSPCDRHTNSLYSGRGKTGIKSLSRSSLIPISPLHIACIKVIAEVPAEAKLFSHLCSQIAWEGRKSPSEVNVFVISLLVSSSHETGRNMKSVSVSQIRIDSDGKNIACTEH